MRTRRTPAAHVAVALHAVTGHMVDNDLPLPVSLQVRHGDQIEVHLYELAFDAWVNTLTRLDGTEWSVDEHQTKSPWDDVVRVHADGATDSGVRVRIRSTRQALTRRTPGHVSDWSSETAPVSPWADTAMGAGA